MDAAERQTRPEPRGRAQGKELIMAPRFSPTYLRRLRNEIPIRDLIADILDVPCKVSEGHFRFLCPRCREFNTATNPKTNLARCFRCAENFNPIDVTMLEKRYDFLEAVAFLEQFLGRARRPTHDVPTRGSVAPTPRVQDRDAQKPRKRAHASERLRPSDGRCRTPRPSSH